MRTRIKTQISLRTSGVTYENAFLGSMIKLMIRVRSKVRIACTAKDLKLG